MAVITLVLVLGVAAARPSVVVSIHPLFDVVRQVAGEHADVVRVLPPGVSPHTFDPTPRDVRRIATADLVVFVGGLDLWLRNLVEASGTRAPLLELMSSPSILDHLTREYPELTREEDLGPLGPNPHVWLDPVLMAEAAMLVADALADIDPGQADAYRRAAERVATELRALDDEIREALAPVSGAAFVPFHDAWPYFAARYDLDLIVEIEPFPGREPSPAYLRYALDKVRESGATAVFSEVQLNRRPAEVVAQEAGVALFELDPLGGFPGRDDYASFMRYNVTVILEAFQ